MNVACVTDMINKSALFSLAWSFYDDKLCYIYHWDLFAFICVWHLK